jgi:hypothetical protein
MGRRILPRLLADPRLTEAAAAMQAGQESLEAKHTAHEDAVESARRATAERDQAYRGMEDRLREFALNVLSTVRNNHGADSYLRYFPLGYGAAVRESPEQISEVTRVVLGKLAEETDPWLAAFRDRITSAHEAFLAAQNRCVDAIRGRNDAFAYLVAEKRLWIRALAVSRLKVREVCLGEEAYVRMIFSAAEAPRRRMAGEPAAGDLAVGDPAAVGLVAVEPAVVKPAAVGLVAVDRSADASAQVEAPVGASVPSPAPMLAAASSDRRVHTGPFARMLSHAAAMYALWRGDMVAPRHMGVATFRKESTSTDARLELC